MVYIKKLALAPFFLFFQGFLIFSLSQLIGSYDFIFSLSVSTLLDLVIIAASFVVSSFFFVILSALISDLKFSLPFGILGAVFAFIFLPPALALIFAVVMFVSFLLASLNLDIALKTYLNFQPNTLFGPVVKTLTGLLVISFCVVYFLSSSQLINQKGFEIPDSLIDSALKMMPTNLPSGGENQTPIQLPQISQEQLTMLKQNPDLLEQYGLDPDMLDTLNNPTQNSQNQLSLNNNLIKQTVKDQIQTFIKPYINFIPAILALLLFLTLLSLVSLINIFIPPLLWVVFLILEKSGYIKFQTEMREVKKMVV